MYVVTNTAEIAAAIEAKQPRPLSEVMRETFPDAVEDANGRFHAPYDEYTVNGIDFWRGGEFLPFDNEQAKGGSNWRLWVIENGAVVCFEGTRAQITAGIEIAKRQQADFDREREHVGAVGKREVFKLTIANTFHQFGTFGDEFTHYMRDEANNPVVYKGSKRLGKNGESLTVKATVKSHWVAEDGRKATYIARPAMV